MTPAVGIVLLKDHTKLTPKYVNSALTKLLH